MSNSNIMTIKEMIDSAFGDSDENIVNFKLIQMILYILARQLRVLERRVGVDIGPGVIRSTSSISIREVKLLANIPKKKKKVIKNVDEISNKNKAVPTVTVPISAKTKYKDELSSKSKPTKPSDKSTFKSTTETSTSGPSSSLKTSTSLSSDKTKLPKEVHQRKDYHHLLEAIEQERERELRIVNQRADSREEAEKAPTPMISLDSIELQYEKLLIVERVPSDDAQTRTGRSRNSKEVKLSVVTKEQFDNLAQIVNELQDKFSSTGKPILPDNMKLMQDLRRGASLTDAMTALQLSARLDAAELTLQQMMSLITDLAISKGIEIAEFQQPSKSSTPRKKSPKSEKKVTEVVPTEMIKFQLTPLTEASGTEVTEDLREYQISEISNIKRDIINFKEMDDAIQEMYDSLLKSVRNITNKIASNAESALKLAHKLEEKLYNTTSLDSRMNDLEALVSEYAEKINILDTGLSSQMTNYQEQLTQMQHDLETGIESMTEALANTGGDTAAVAELNLNFTNLQLDFDTTNIKQKELKENQEILSTGLQTLWKQIEILSGTKSDRDEVADALRDKAGLGALNGLVTQQQFDAVRGDFEKRIGAAYDKFNNQEIIWQKAIDDLLRELNEKADLVQVNSLRNDINENLEKLRNKINVMMDIVGEPKSAAISKKLFQDTACLSCSSPAHMDIEEPNKIPSLPPLPNSFLPFIEADNIIVPKEDGDHGLCYPGKPIPHPRDPRSIMCRRYCGGSHTIVSSTKKRAPSEMIITSVTHTTTTGRVLDKKIDTTNHLYEKPCTYCNLSIRPPQPLENVREHIKDDSEITDLEMFAKTTSLTADNLSITPPPPYDND